MISSQRTDTVQQRWAAASKVLRNDGVKFLFNVSKCCRSCITHEDLRMSDDSQPYGYTYGGQGNRIFWDEDGKPTYAASRGDHRKPVFRAYINHGNGAAQRIVAAFRAAGFDATWDGSQHSCVEVNF